jgi:hypothetical protein
MTIIHKLEIKLNTTIETMGLKCGQKLYFLQEVIE